MSYVAGLVSALAVAWLAARFARSIWAGGLAAAMLIGLGFSESVPWFALYRVDMLALALSLGTIVTLVLGTRTGHILVAAVLAAAAILTKQTYFAAALAGIIWLWSIQRWRAAVFGFTAIGLALLVCAVEQVTTGQFYANTIFANAANPST
jgi:hypothetical protein